MILTTMAPGLPGLPLWSWMVEFPCVPFLFFLLPSFRYLIILRSWHEYFLEATVPGTFLPPTHFSQRAHPDS